MLQQFLLVGLGGFIGACARYGILLLCTSLCYYMRFPVGTLLVNLLGCFAIGYLSGRWTQPHGVQTALLLFCAVGILGGFTTFSSFGLDLWRQIQQGDLWLAGLNASIQVFGGIALVWLGFMLASC